MKNKTTKILWKETRKTRELMFYFILIFLSTTFLTNLKAAWVDNETIELTQPDAVKINALTTGDEFHHWVHDENGYTIVYDDNTGFWCWATLQNDCLVSTGYPIHLTSPQSSGLQPYLNISEDKYLELRASYDNEFNLLSVNELYTGVINNIVIFITFPNNTDCTKQCEADCALSATDFFRSFMFYDALFNDAETNANSLYQYFWTVSYENLEVFSYLYPAPNNSSVVSYPAPHPKHYYNTISRRSGLLLGALNFVKNSIPSNLNLDNNNDGNIDNISFIVRGGAGSWASVLWSHKARLPVTPPIMINGKRAYDYNLLSEIHLYDGIEGGTRAIAHELGHTMGFPDLYRYDDVRNSNKLDPMWWWDVMSTGVSSKPSSMSTYTKWRYTNWVDDIPIITEDGQYTLYPILIHPDQTTQKNRAYRINSPNSDTEYFVVEYRNKDIDRIDSAFFGSGLVIYRINTSRSGLGNRGGPPFEIYSMRPNGSTQSAGNPDLGHFPANPYHIVNPYYDLLYERNSIHDNSNPSPFLSDGSPGGIHITNIGEPGETISFYFSTTTHEHDLVAHKVTGPLHAAINIPAEFNIEVINIGITQASDYTVQLRHGNDVLASVQGVTLPSARSHIYTLSWTPTVEGQFPLSGFVEYTLDEKTSNNKSPNIVVSTKTNPDLLSVEPEHCIHAAINIIAPNGTLTLRNGIHESPCSICNQDTVYLNGKNIKIQGSTNFAAETIVKQKFEISNVTDATIIEKIIFEPSAADNYTAAIKLINSTPKINDLKFNMSSSYDIVGIHIDLSHLGSDAVLEISNSIFNGKQGVYLNGHDSFLSTLIVRDSEFNENSSMFGHYGEGSAISFRGTHLDVINSKFNIQEIDTENTNPIQIVLKNNSIDKEINLIKNEFVTHRNVQTTNPGHLLFTPASQQTILVSGSGRYNLLVERNVFKRINHLSGDTTTNNIIVLGVSPISPSFETRLLNNSEISLKPAPNNTLVYLDNPDLYSFISHGGKLLARNNLLTGEITATSGSAINDVQGTWDIGIHGNPNIDLLSMQPIWNQTTRSGLINSGYVLSRISWFDDPDYTDNDGTRVDIGAVPAISHGSFKHTLTREGNGNHLAPSPVYNWVAFPYLVRNHYLDHGKTIFDELHLYNQNNLLDTNQPFTTIIQWNTTGNIESSYHDPIDPNSIDGWVNSDHIVESRYGYKVYLPVQVYGEPGGVQAVMSSPHSIVTSGFFCNKGETGNTSAIMTLLARDPEQPYREQWFGYFKPQSICPLFSLQDVLPHLIEIKTRNWTYSKINDVWESDHRLPRLVQGEAVSLRYTGTIDRTFEWQQDSTVIETYVHPQAIYFEYEEEADYIPIFVNLSEDMAGEDDAELAVFINDVCYGAAVIYGTTVQINAYVMDVDFEGAEIEFQYYKYNSRSGGIVIDDYKVYDPITNEYLSKNNGFNQKSDFYVVSFKNALTSGTDMVLPEKTALNGNFPNPFNPSTTISYSLAKQENVDLKIYNIRGQLVKTLVNEAQDAGNYSVEWNGSDNNSNRVSSGVYFYKFETSVGTEVKRMVLMK